MRFKLQLLIFFKKCRKWRLMLPFPLIAFLSKRAFFAYLIPFSKLSLLICSDENNTRLSQKFKISFRSFILDKYADFSKRSILIKDEISERSFCVSKFLILTIWQRDFIVGSTRFSFLLWMIKIRFSWGFFWLCSGAGIPAILAVSGSLF